MAEAGKTIEINVIFGHQGALLDRSEGFSEYLQS